jgi:hypothetical protein
MFITVFSGDVSPVSGVELALALCEEFFLREKRVALIDASFTMSASLAGLDLLKCEADKPQTCLPIFRRPLSTREVQSSTYTLQGCPIPVFQGIECSKAFVTIEQLGADPDKCFDYLVYNLGVLQRRFDVVIAINHLSLDDINGELACSSDYIVLHAESVIGATNALNFFFSKMKRKVVLVQGCRIPSTFRVRGLARSFRFWVNKESPLTAFLMRGMNHFTHVGAESRVRGYKKTVRRKIRRLSSDQLV